MARYQYRVAGKLDWMSNSGNALLVISNPTGSGKKLTIKRFELSQQSVTNTASAGTVSAGTATSLALARGTVTTSGNTLVPVPLDTDADAWPDTVKLSTGSTLTSPGVAINRNFVLKQLNQNSLSWMGRRRPYSKFMGRLWKGSRESGVEPIVVREGEGVALYVDVAGGNSLPLRVSASLERTGSPNRTFIVSYFTTVLPVVGQCVFAVDNAGGSGETITVRGLSVEEVGTYDTPYFQLVPVGALNPNQTTDTLLQPSILPMDTDYPSPSSWMKVYKDVVMLPYNMPENALSDGSTGSPKGFNYLKTKDFLGPVYRTILPEGVGIRTTGAMPDVLFGVGHRWADTMTRFSAITIREGEAIALVSGAETAAGATVAVGMAGWSSYEFGVQVDIEPKLVPRLTLTGLKNPSEVRIFDAGTTTELAGQENVTSGTFTWDFDPETYPSVDIHILSLGYLNLRLPATALSLADLSIPIQQTIDRQYLNP